MHGYVEEPFMKSWMGLVHSIKNSYSSENNLNLCSLPGW